MRKNLIKYIFILISALIMLTGTSCTDTFEYDRTDQGIEDGIPVRVRIAMTTGSMSIKTRSDMENGTDNEVNTIWLAFFFENGDKAQSTILETSNNKPEEETHDILKGNFEIDVHSGKYYIAAVANPRGNYGVKKGSSSVESLETLLEDVKTFDEFKNIALVQDAGDISTPIGNLVMQGVYVSNTSDHSSVETSDGVSELANTPINVPGNAPQAEQGHFVLDGAIHFRRLISHVNFKFGYDPEKISSFEPISATVSNVPMTSWIAERDDSDRVNRNSGDALTNLSATNDYRGNYHESPIILEDQMGQDGNYRTFDWYQLENRRTGYATKYEDREEETKNADNSNTGTYVALQKYNRYAPAPAANQMATFVTFNVRMRMKDPGTTPDGTPGKYRIVEGKYTIHLGAIGNEYTDFNCHRNTKYTYTVTIKDVDKIQVEARQESATQYEHGAEGVVTVITDSYMSSDAHFTAYNICLTSDELKGFRWTIRTPSLGGTSTYDINESNFSSFDSMYWDWVEFRPTTGENVIADYKPISDSQTYSLNDMTNLTTTQQSSSGWYTVFINEYVYEKDGGLTTDNWKKYVNLPERSVWLKVEEKRSSDGESVIFGSKYAIAQQSIQTYYSDAPTAPSKGVGIEHLNENEANGSPLISGYYNPGNTKDSRYLTWWSLNYGKNPDQMTRALIDIVSNNPATSISNGSTTQNGVAEYNDKQYTVTQACLNRNRDLNGNGIIDRSEMRWFVPTDEQYVQIAIGSQALANPLFSFKGLTEGVSETSYITHYAGINNRMLWAEEGVSTGDTYQYGYNPMQIRCVRNLGMDMNVLDIDSQPDQTYQLGENNTINFYYADEVYRAPAFNSQLPIHHVNSVYARPYRKIQYKDEVLNLGTIYSNVMGSSLPADTQAWFDLVNTVNPCAQYNVDGQTGWRAPNQSELGAIFFLGLNDKERNYLISSTRSFFGFSNGRRITAINAGAQVLFAMGSGYFSFSTIRCVRDVR